MAGSCLCLAPPRLAVCVPTSLALVFPFPDHPTPPLETTIKSLAKLAKELRVVLPVSFFERVNNAHYNSLAMIDADGSVLGVYRKSHIPDGPG